MAALDCTRESDVIDAIASHRWPARVDAELREHVAACAVCADVAEVVTALHAEQDTAWTDAASLPSAQVVWFRAQARARADATRQASRPIAIMQALGFACAATVISGLIGVVAFWVWSRTDLLAAVPAIPVVGPDAIGMAIRGTLLAIGVWLVLAPFAVYLVASDD
jgi:hypothetical protein